MTQIVCMLLACLALSLWPIVPTAPSPRRDCAGGFRARMAAAIYRALRHVLCRALQPCAAPRGYRRTGTRGGYCRSTRVVGKPAWVRHEVLRLRALLPRGAGCRTIADLFNRRFAGHADPARRNSVCSSTVGNWVKANQYQVTVMRRNLKHRLPPALPRNLVWGLDLTGKGDPVGDVHAILGIVDHGSRACLALEAVKDKSSITLLRALLVVIEKFGKPKVIRTDNESVMTSRLFRFGLWWLGIKHQRSAVSSPWMNGRIERFFGTLKHSLDQLAVDSRDALNAALVDFRFFYNHVRGHQHLAGLTPAEAWSGFRWKINDSAGLNLTAVTKSAAAIAGLPPVQEKFWFEAWDGLLTGYYLRR